MLFNMFSFKLPAILPRKLLPFSTPKFGLVSEFPINDILAV